jgi:hypothetical protein
MFLNSEALAVSCEPGVAEMTEKKVLLDVLTVQRKKPHFLSPPVTR